MDTKRIIKDPQEQFYGHKFDNLDGNKPILKRHNLPEFIQETGNLNRPYIYQIN